MNLLKSLFARAPRPATPGLRVRSRVRAAAAAAALRDAAVDYGLAL